MTVRETVRQPAVAGLFYPADRRELAESVRAHLDLGSALVRREAGMRSPKAIVAPHAGYDYSGPIAGSAFSAWSESTRDVRRVIVLGPAHRVALRGLALPGSSAMATPLGNVAIDGELAERVLELPQVVTHAGAHAQEHSLEVELPFLQLLFEDFTVLPLVVGDARPNDVAEVLGVVWGGEETRIVISSDLSHYLPYDEARVADRSTAEKILACDGPLGPYDACGAYCLNGLLVAARARGMRCDLLDLRNSGDTAGDRRRVVGYGAFAFWEA
jgi:AmmeMemoRadiSam system protein B